MSDDYDDDEDDDLDVFPLAGEEIDWNVRCQKCPLFACTVHVQDQTWKGYCMADNDPFRPHRVYNTSVKCGIGQAIDLAQDSNNKKNTLCNKCGKSVEKFIVKMTHYPKGIFKGLVECVGIYCEACQETEPTKTVQEIDKEFKEKHDDGDFDYEEYLERQHRTDTTWKAKFEEHGIKDLDSMVSPADDTGTAHFKGEEDE